MDEKLRTQLLELADAWEAVKDEAWDPIYAREACAGDIRDLVKRASDD